jgi:hypothetical protein
MDSDDPETANAFLNVVQSGDSLSIPIDTTFTPFSWSPENLMAPSLAISPDANRVMAVVNTENGSGLIEVNLLDPNPAVKFVTVLPKHFVRSKMGFSPDGKWVYVNYWVEERGYVGFLEVGTEKFIITYECRKLVDFLTDDSVVCNYSQNVNDIGKLTLGEFSMEKTYLDIPHRKLLNATGYGWSFEALVPEMNSFILHADGYYLIPDLDYYGPLPYWYPEDRENVINSPKIAKFHSYPTLIKFNPSPGKEQIAVTGINDRGLGMGFGIDSDTFTFVINPGETYYQPEDPELPGTPFYALKWSPDSRVLVGLSLQGNLSIWVPMTGEMEVLHTNTEQPKIYYLNEGVHGIAVEWLD